MPGDRIEQQIALTGDKDIQAVFRTLERTGQAAFDKLAKASEGLTRESAKTAKGLQEIEATATTLGRSLRTSYEGVRAFASGLSGLARATSVAVGGLLAFTKSGADVADNTRDQAAGLGFATEEYSKFTFALGQAGADARSARTAITRLADVIGDAVQGGEMGTKIFNQLGIQFAGANGRARSLDAILGDVAERFSQMPNGVEKTAEAIELFGARAGPQLIPLLNEGRAGIAAMAADVTRLGGVVTERQGQIGDAFNDALGRLSAAAGGIRNALTEVLAPAFTDAFNTIADILADNREALQGIVRGIVNTVVPAFVALKNVAVPVFRAVYDAIALVVEAFNTLAGTDISAQQVVLVGVFVALVTVLGSVAASIASLMPGLSGLIGALTGIPALINLILGPGRLLLGLFTTLTSSVQLATLVLNPWVLLLGAAVAVLAVLATQLASVDWTPFITSVQAAFAIVQETIATAITAIQDSIAAIWNNITQAAAIAVADMLAVFDQFRATVINYFSAIRSYILQVLDEARKALASAFSARGSERAQTIRATGLAGGGPVRGRGTGTSDSIPIWASNGEFMLRAAAVRKYGVSFLNALNSMRFDPDAFGYALGGLITPHSIRPRLAYADGGMIAGPRSAGNTLNLTIGGETFQGLETDDDTMARLSRFATRRQLQSAGRKPRWKQ